ncbi:MAG: hypothetical protein C0629_03615 [Chromatiales bacterium]|nr:MAG: hypothetical protein C0629_03615 [Chromatiales bacterium]
MALFSELKRRNVLRMAVLYVVAAWLIMQVAEVLIGLGVAPDSIGPATFKVLLIGFPIALAISWYYEITPEGLKLEKNVDRGESITHVTGRRMDFIVIALLSAALLLFAYDKWWPRGTMDQSIAVLPFTNMSGDAAQEYFSDGISEELLNLLAQFQDLRVISRSSSFSFKGKDVDLRTIADQLNVSHVLEGSVRRSGDQIRITAQLIDARSDAHLWSQSYDRQFGDIFAVQEEIAGAIGDALKVRLALTADEAVRRVPAKAANMDAYDAYLEARELIRRRGRENLEVAVELLERALRLDEAFAPAHAQLAIATWHLENRVSRPNLEQARRTASRHIDRAQEIEPELAEAYAGRALLALGDDQNAAVNFAQKALLLNPSYTEVMNWLYIALLRLGRYEEYVATLEALLEKDPLNPIGQWNYITMLARQGRITEADDFAGSDMIDNSGRGSYLDLVTAIPWRGDIADGILSHLIYRAEFPTRRTEIDELVQAFVWIGEYDEARRLDPDLAFLVDVAEGRFDSAILATQSRMQQNPENQSSIQAAANVLYAAGRIDGALPLFESLLALRPKGLPLADGEATMRLAFGRRSAGNEQGAQEIAEIVRKDQAARHAAGFHNQYENRTKAMLAAFDGEPDRVIAEFKTAIDIGLRDPLVFADPIFEGLRDDPRFVKLKEGLDVILAREREKVLQLICFNNPTPDNWQPLPETCEGVERRKE